MFVIIRQLNLSAPEPWLLFVSPDYEPLIYEPRAITRKECAVLKA